MRIFHHPEALPADARGSVVAVGNFDGVHRGHQIVVGEAKAIAEATGAPLAVLSFEPHPRSLFRPADPPFRLTPFRIKARLLEALGIDIHVVMTFDRAFADLSAEAFVDRVLVRSLAARHVVIGYDFRFGHNRTGDAGLLTAAGRAGGFGVTVVTQASDESGGAYSSSRVRELLADGCCADAVAVLGRPWEIEGRVERGDQRGRLLGYPTANVDLGEFLRPAFGVYAVRAAIDTPGTAPNWHDGVANIGIRPMYRSEHPLLEVHLFNYDGDLYGRHLRVQLVDYLRGEARFDSAEALVVQMNRDSTAARAALSRSTDSS